MGTADIDALLSQASSARQKDDIVGALRQLRRAAKLAPRDPVVLLALGTELDRQDDHVRAAQALRRAAEIAPNNAEILNALGNAEQGARRPEKALECYQKAAVLAPDVAAAQINIGDMLRSLNRRDEACGHFKNALKLDSDAVTAHYHLAVLALENSNPTLALEHLASIDSLNPYLPEGIALKVMALGALNREDEASRLLDYDRFLQVVKLPTPDGYPNIRKFNRELERHILGQRLTINPFSASTRGGRHGDDLLSNPKGPAAQLNQALRTAFSSYIEALPIDASHPFLSAGSRSVRLIAQANILDSSGYLEDHVHPQAWVSGAYYVRLPSEVDAANTGDRAGWLRFGALPGHLQITPTIPIRYVAPSEGQLVLFPSYFYHGTLPFRARKHRMSLGIDVICQ